MGSVILVSGIFRPSINLGDQGYVYVANLDSESSGSHGPDATWAGSVWLSLSGLFISLCSANVSLFSFSGFSLQFLVCRSLYFASVFLMILWRDVKSLENLQSHDQHVLHSSSSYHPLKHHFLFHLQSEWRRIKPPPSFSQSLSEAEHSVSVGFLWHKTFRTTHFILLLPDFWDIKLYFWVKSVDVVLHHLHWNLSLFYFNVSLEQERLQQLNLSPCSCLSLDYCLKTNVGKCELIL